MDCIENVVENCEEDDIDAPEFPDFNALEISSSAGVSQDAQDDTMDKLSSKWVHEDCKWLNITKEFFDACSELSLGELVHHEIFGLFEAMSAIEMMDPKMDVGMGYSKNDPVPHTFQTAVDAGVLKLADLTNSELIGVCDALNACLVSWLEGHSLDQILFTCLYLHYPNDIKDKSLRAYCLGMRKMISLVKQFVSSGRVYEEEDFQLYGSALYDTDSLVQLNDSKVISLLKEAEDDLIKKSKADSNPEELLAIMHRLRFLRSLFQALYLLFPKKRVSPTEAEMVEIQRNLNTAYELIPAIRKTIEKGTQPDPNSDAPNPMGFSPRVNQKYLPPTFPRSAKIRDRPSSFVFFGELIQRLKLSCKVIHQNDYHSALNFFIDFSKKSGQCVLSRSVLQTIFFGNIGNFVFGFIPFEDFLRESIKMFIAPPVLMPKHPLYNNPQAKKCVESFLTYCTNMQTFVYFLQICGYNRARQRGKLARIIEEGFSNLQDESGRVDSYLNILAAEKDPSGQHIAYFGTWTLYHCLRAMSLYLLSGFELELYSIHEFLYIYWYLYEFLFGFIVSALTRADSLLSEQENLMEQCKGNSGKQRKPKPNKKKKQQKPFRREIMYNHAMQNLCGGYYKATAAFTKDERIKQPMPKFDNEKIRFNHRFAPFGNLTSPPPIPYSEFKNMRELLLRPSSSELFLAAAKNFHQARTILEQIQNPDQEIAQMIQISKVNFVVTNLLAKGHKKESKTPPEFDFSQHRYFPVIKLN